MSLLSMTTTLLLATFNTNTTLSRATFNMENPLLWATLILRSLCRVKYGNRKSES